MFTWLGNEQIVMDSDSESELFQVNSFRPILSEFYFLDFFFSLQQVCFVLMLIFAISLSHRVLYICSLFYLYFFTAESND